MEHGNSRLSFSHKSEVPEWLNILYSHTRIMQDCPRFQCQHFATFENLLTEKARKEVSNKAQLCAHPEIR
jgi:hypothetical protein